MYETCVHFWLVSITILFITSCSLCLSTHAFSYSLAGARYYTANVHQLLHSVRLLGPLWAHSTFPFEDANGWLGDLFNGTKHPDKQVR